MPLKRPAWFAFARMLACSLLLVGCSRTNSAAEVLSFKRDGKLVRSAALSALAERLDVRSVETADPYYGAYKRFSAFPLAPALSWAFGVNEMELRRRGFVLTALDGYSVSVEGARLIDDGAFVAIDDLDIPGFAPIGPRKVSPRPAYLIWQGSAHNNLETHPRPWQLVAIDSVDPLTLYPHTRPIAQAGDAQVMRGFHLFRERCSRCHAINREGGRLGPELNVPQSIVHYRPEPQIRAYIKNPLTFRYGAMPANPDLGEAELDALIAYFRAKADEPYDPDAQAAARSVSEAKAP